VSENQKGSNILIVLMLNCAALISTGAQYIKVTILILRLLGAAILLRSSERRAWGLRPESSWNSLEVVQKSHLQP
jgi:hypothetical protein